MNGKEVTRDEFTRAIEARRVRVEPLFTPAIATEKLLLGGEQLVVRVAGARTQQQILERIRYELAATTRDDRVIYDTHGGLHTVVTTSFGEEAAKVSEYRVNVGGAGEQFRMSLERFAQGIRGERQPAGVFELQACNLGPRQLAEEFQVTGLRGAEFRYGETTERVVDVGVRVVRPMEKMAVVALPSPPDTPGITILPRKPDEHPRPEGRGEERGDRHSHSVWSLCPWPWLGSGDRATKRGTRTRRACSGNPCSCWSTPCQ